MTIVRKSKLQTLYKASEIAAVWNASQNLTVINHSKHGLISPNDYHVMYKAKPCPYCGQKMVHGKAFYSTSSKQEAVKRSYEYVDR